MTVPMVGVLDGHRADTRTNDPETSHAAHDILAIHEFRHARGIARHEFTGQRLRTARNELVEYGRVVQTEGEALTPSGRRAKVWGIA